MTKVPFAGIELTSQRVRGLRGTSELPGRPVCVCVCFLPIHSGHQWTYQPGSHIHLLSAARALIFSREKDSAIPFPRRP